MANVAVMTDAVSGISAELAEKYRIRVVPTAHIIYDDHSYIEGVTINAMQAYELLRQDPDKFNTSAISPEYLLQVYRELSQKSTEILFITVSLALSAVFRSASLAAELFHNESPGTTIRVIDSRSVASGLGLVVLAAASVASQGMSLEQVVNITQQAQKKTSTLILIDTLRYAYRTGRVPRVASALGAMLGVKPITRIGSEGALHPVAIVRTRRSGFSRLLDLIIKETRTESLHFMIMHAAAPQAAEELAALIKSRFNCLSMIITEFSPVMGYGSGSGSLSVSFHPELGFDAQAA